MSKLTKRLFPCVTMGKYMKVYQNKLKCKDCGIQVSELRFNVPSTTRLYGGGTSVYSLIRKTGKRAESIMPSLDWGSNVIHYTTATPWGIHTSIAL